MLTSFFFLLVYPDKSINPPVKEEPEYRKPLDLKITICRFTEDCLQIGHTVSTLFKVEIYQLTQTKQSSSAAFSLASNKDTHISPDYHFCLTLHQKANKSVFLCMSGSLTVKKKKKKTAEGARVMSPICFWRAVCKSGCGWIQSLPSWRRLTLLICS